MFGHILMMGDIILLTLYHLRAGAEGAGRLSIQNKCDKSAYLI